MNLVKQRHGLRRQRYHERVAARSAAKLINGSQLIVYTGAPHGLTDTHKDRVNQDLLKFLQQ